MYGSFIMNKRNEDPTFRKGIDDLPTIPIILSEWTDMKPNVHRMLPQYRLVCHSKGTTQSYAEAIRGTFQDKSYQRMETYDRYGWDIYYNKFLINGKTKVK
jgi:hypothetical protein